MEEVMDLKLSAFGWPAARSISPAVFPGPAQVRAYWEGLRRDGGIPDRAKLDPRGFDGALDRIFLAERIGRGLVQVRIAGSALSEAAGMDLRGLPLSCLFSSEARPALAEVLEQVTAGLALTELDLASNSGGLGAVARLVLMPLTDGSDRRLVLGCLGHADGLLEPGLKFTILRRQDERLTPVASPVAPEPPLRKVPYLTLVHARD
jgi:hypothetical protein